MSAARNSFEDNLERLQAIVDQLESGELPLEKGVALYKEGLGLTRTCRKELDKARLIVSKATAEGLEPFEAESAS